jgi:hypothetical protein
LPAYLPAFGGLADAAAAVDGSPTTIARHSAAIIPKILRFIVAGKHSPNFGSMGRLREI